MSKLYSLFTALDHQYSGLLNRALFSKQSYLTLVAMVTYSTVLNFHSHNSVKHRDSADRIWLPLCLYHKQTDQVLCIAFSKGQTSKHSRHSLQVVDLYCKVKKATLLFCKLQWSTFVMNQIIRGKYFVIAEFCYSQLIQCEIYRASKVNK